MNDTTRRFLSAITERVPEGGRIVELRLFPAIRQGGIESGVAVVAVEPPAVATEPPPDAADDAEVVSDAAVDVAADASGDDRDFTLDSAEDGDVPDESIGERVVPHLLDGRADDPTTEAALDLVDTDVAPEDEEGSADDDEEGTTTYIPSADMTDDDTVADALDDEMTTIVVDATHEVRRIEARAATPSAFAAGIRADQRPEADDGREPDQDAPESRAEAEGAAAAGATAAGGVRLDVADDDQSPYADAPPPPDAPRRELLADVALGDDDPDAMRLDDILALPSPDESDDEVENAPPADVPAATRTIQRYAILTASYRLTIKGPDRGKWDVDMTHEADAPLATLERVARGVSKRSGDGSEPEHFSGESLRQALDAPAWIETT